MLIVNGKRIVPAPLVNLSKTLVLSGDNRPIGVNFSITLSGTLLPSRGSPYADGTFLTGTGDPVDENYSTAADKFDSILRKQDALRELFLQPGLLLEYGPDDGSPAVLGRVSLRSMNFTEGTWVDKSLYTITLESEDVNKQGSSTETDLSEFDDYFLLSASETIQIQESATGDGSIVVTHTVSATGKASYSGVGTFVGSLEPWENAKTWCESRTSGEIITGLVNTTGKTKYNSVSNESIDTLAGTYSITTTYTISASNESYIHTYDVNTSTARSQIDDLNSGQQLIQTVTINGTIVGLAASNLAADKLTAAQTAFATIEATIPTLCDLNSSHVYATKSYAENTTNGTITYSYTFNNYPDSQQYTHTISANDTKSSGGVSQIALAGSLKGVTSLGATTNIFTNLQNTWENTVKPSLRATAATLAGVSLVNSPASFTISFNKTQMQIDYTVVYNYADGIANATGANYLDQFEVSLNDANVSSTSQNTIKPGGTLTINGSITGFDEDGVSDDRYAAALSRWNTVKGLLRTRIQDATGLTVTNRILSKSISFNQVNGTINYSFTYTGNTDITNDGIISEDIQIETVDPSEVYAIQPIPGLSTGPIFQNIGTITEARKTLSVSFILDTNISSSVGDTRFTELKNEYAPTETPQFYTNGPKVYNPNTGSYTRSITWTYRGT